jgi:uncharacterized membrane protein
MQPRGNRLPPNEFGFPNYPGYGERNPQRPRRRPFTSALRHLERRMVAGLLVFLPVLVTYFVFKFFYDVLASLLEPFVRWLSIPKTGGFDWTDLVGVAAVLVVIYIVGLLISWAVAKFLINQIHDLIGRIPVVGAVYNTTRVGIDFLSDTQEQQYRGVVLIEFPRMGVLSIGLITSNLGKLDGVEEHLSIYVPTTPVPSSGYLVVVASSKVKPTDITVDEAMRIIISGGILAGAVFSDRVVLNGSEALSPTFHWLWGSDTNVLSAPPPSWPSPAPDLVPTVMETQD